MTPSVTENQMKRGKHARASCERSKHCGNASEPRRVSAAPVARGGEKAEQLHSPKDVFEVFRTSEALLKIRAEIDGEETRGKGQMPRREGRRKVKMHKSKAESVISWCCQRQTKAHQRAVVCSGVVLFKCSGLAFWGGKRAKIDLLGR